MGKENPHAAPAAQGRRALTPLSMSPQALQPHHATCVQVAQETGSPSFRPWRLCLKENYPFYQADLSQTRVATPFPDELPCLFTSGPRPPGLTSASRLPHSILPPACARHPACANNSLDVAPVNALCLLSSSPFVIAYLSGHRGLKTTKL